jgi:hypothetical protein
MFPLSAIRALSRGQLESYKHGVTDLILPWVTFVTGRTRRHE